MNLTINHWIRFSGNTLLKDGVKLSLEMNSAITSPEELYSNLEYKYPKFFKMDALCKWAWLGAECLLNDSDGFCYEGIDTTKIAVVLGTSQGCLDVDKKYQDSMRTIPSPALFVYTLNNIMLGEICIRHGFKGEQSCNTSDLFDAEELYFWVNDLLNKRGMEACLCGFADAANKEHDLVMFWVTKNGNASEFSPTALQQYYDLSPTAS